MREIKFRVWSEKLKEMLLVDKLDLTGDEGAIVFDENADEHYFTNSPTMQYTGLKDKNGSVIYEGDIVRSKEFGIKEVYWDNDFSCWRIGRGCEQEVIGNIYENPELLTP